MTNIIKKQREDMVVDGIPLKEIRFRKTAIIARQILLSFVDFHRFYIPMFDKRRIYRIPFRYYDKFREKDKEHFSHEIYRLKRAGFIKKYFLGKEEMVELLAKGRKKINNYLIQNLTISQPKKWDRKWRIVIYDITDAKKNEREYIRRKLEELGFLKIQESVWVYPFDCLREIRFLKGLFFLSPYVQYIVAEKIETEIDLIKKFYDRGLLTDKMLN